MEFLQQTATYLTQLRDNLGYDSCHRTLGYDAEACAADCAAAQRGEFARNCAARGGLYKCCIRRDKVFCHECRFCCSLSICTTKVIYFVNFLCNSYIYINKSIFVRKERLS